MASPKFRLGGTFCKNVLIKDFLKNFEKIYKKFAQKFKNFSKIFQKYNLIEFKKFKQN